MALSGLSISASPAPAPAAETKIAEPTGKKEEGGR